MSSEQTQEIIGQASLLFEKLDELAAQYGKLTNGDNLLALHGYVKNYNFAESDNYSSPNIENCFFPVSNYPTFSSQGGVGVLEKKKSARTGRKRNPNSEEGCRRSLILEWLRDNPEGGKLREVAAGLEGDGFQNSRKTELAKIIYQDMLVLMRDEKVVRCRGIYRINN